MIDLRCHACNEEDSYSQFYWRAQNNKAIPDTYQCLRCEHIFRNFKGDTDNYHREKYRVQGEEGHEMYQKEERLRYISTIIEQVRPFLDSEMTALEIGSGDGLFATQIGEHVKSIKCSDIDAKMTKKCERLGFEAVNISVLDIDDEDKYDVIFGFDVLEHVLDIQSFNTKMSAIVNRLLVLQVPIDRTMVPPNERFDGHSHYFSPKSITSLLAEHFNPKGIYYAPPGTLARGPELLCIFEKRAPK